MKIGQEVFVIVARRAPSSGAYFWYVEHRQVVSHDRETVCVCGTPSGRLQFHPVNRVYENVGIADSVRDDYTVRGLTPHDVFGD